MAFSVGHCKVTSQLTLIEGDTNSLKKTQLGLICNTDFIVPLEVTSEAQD